ncbi:hypothetical protein VIGAN_04185100 [Vigna angularis var. angularis]|uniref:DUF632 domain-containing protein n=1 Tax=Vigna angularis var. angularis TaxID=157739 RepID=A0A0S3RVI8_PHAAN|nr:hypothetical protein VIGAN_04185100 [Vigna angularis var. angularis]
MLTPWSTLALDVHLGQSWDFGPFVDLGILGANDKSSDAESVGSVRKEGNMVSRVAKAGSDDKGEEKSIFSWVKREEVEHNLVRVEKNNDNNISNSEGVAEKEIIGVETVKVVDVATEDQGKQRGLAVLDTPVEGRKLLETLKDIEDHFLKAYDSRKSVGVSSQVPPPPLEHERQQLRKSKRPRHLEATKTHRTTFTPKHFGAHRGAECHPTEATRGASASTNHFFG